MKRTYTLLVILFIISCLTIFVFILSKINLQNDTSYKENNYKRNYNYIKYKNLDKIDFTKKNNIENSFYTILNNGYNKYKFYCSENIDCINNIKEFINNKEALNNINNYLNPFNTFENISISIKNKNEILIKIDKLYNNSEINKINNEIDKIIDNLNLKDNDNKNNIKKIHDYIIENVTFDSKSTKNSKVTTALFDKKASSLGYSDLFSIMLDKINIPNFKISSNNHIWNAVYIENKWQHIDLSYDDDELHKNNNYNFYLIDTKKLHEIDKKEHNFNTKNYLEFER